MEDRIAAAIQAELRRQGVLYEYDSEEPDLTKLMMCTGEAADLGLVAKAVIAALAP